ncbi:MAG TPA: heme-copper oxidase subunit III [Candidatus Acidoferrales bacterium]|nr:heme-copper oxidase subunit III [Candidatus Acidoferrales bacterium]
MPKEATARKLIDQRSEPPPEIAHGGGPPSFPSSPRPAISNARLGLIMFIAAETMLFAALIGAFLVFRLGSAVWPPPFQPRLPVAVTGVNTAILLASGWSARRALKRLRSGVPRGLARNLSLTALLGLAFLAIQGYEWVRLIHYGLTLSSGVYGATFYTLIGLHGAHVLGALIWLVFVVARIQRAILPLRQRTAVEICVLYWTFVVALWPVLYGLVYLL